MKPNILRSFLPLFVLLVPTAYAQDPPAQSTGTTIRAESRLVLVDAVVTDKKGNYVSDLTEKDFKVFEDDKEQPIKSFAFEQSASSPDAQKHHLVLFFDDDSMKPEDQARARNAAAKFLDNNTGAGRYVAIIDYAGTMRVAQNFTDDTDKLKKVVAVTKLSTAGTENASLGAPMFASYDAFSNRNVLLALRSISRSLASVPGRKSLVWITAGLPLNPDTQAEMTALISACNKANVAVYPIDVRGLQGPVQAGELHPISPEPSQLSAVPQTEMPADSAYDSAAAAEGTPHLVYTGFEGQKSGGGGGGGGGGRTGSTGSTGTAGHTGTTGYSGPRTVAPPPSVFGQQPRTIVPPITPSASVNQQVLYAVANGTGGFVIVNSNDLLSGFERIGKEQSQYYVLGYVPGEQQENQCHTLQVKVERSGLHVRSRSGYCASKPTDFLAGKPIATELENRARGSQPSDVAGFVAAPYFFTSPNTARVNLAVEVPSDTIKFDKVKGKYHAVLNVLGIALKSDGTVGAKFSDAVELDMEKNEVEDVLKHPYHYENQFYVASGEYTLKVAFNSGDKFGRFEIPLVVDNYDASRFGMSDLALSRQFYKVSDLTTGLDSILLQDRTPLVTQGLQLVPSGTNRFKSSDRVAIYLEVYDPVVAEAKQPKVGLQLRILDQKTGKPELEAGIPDTQSSVIPGNPVIPMGVPLPVSKLQPGDYVVELRAVDAVNNASAARKAAFTIE